MIRSMTGYSSKTVEISNKEGERAHLTFTLKSLNSRFFEGICKFPHALQSLEVEAITLLKKRLYRGKAMLSINASNQNIFKGPIKPSLSTIRSYLDAIKVIEQEFKLKESISIQDIIRLPHVLEEQDVELEEALKKTVITTIKDVVDELIKTQVQEGAALYNDIQKRCAELTTTITDIQHRFDTVMQKRKKETEAILKTLNHEQSEMAEIRRNQLLQELERLDIHEEIVRFKSHLQGLQKLLEDERIEKGRKIEFMLQELGRETNTIAAKSSEFGISSLAITIKVELEKIREQAQNIV